MPQTFTALWVHLIWATKNREPILHKSIRIPLYKQIRIIAAQKGYHLDFINGVEDHVHCLFSVQPSCSISQIAKNVKGASSHWLNGQGLLEGPFDWQDGYAAFSVSPSNVQRVRNYIGNQEMHHKTVGFQAELESLKTSVIPLGIEP